MRSSHSWTCFLKPCVGRSLAPEFLIAPARMGIVTNTVRSWKPCHKTFPFSRGVLDATRRRRLYDQTMSHVSLDRMPGLVNMVVELAMLIWVLQLEEEDRTAVFGILVRDIPAENRVWRSCEPRI